MFSQASCVRQSKTPEGLCPAVAHILSHANLNVMPLNIGLALINQAVRIVKHWGGLGARKEIAAGAAYMMEHGEMAEVNEEAEAKAKAEG